MPYYMGVARMSRAKTGDDENEHEAHAGTVVENDDRRDTPRRERVAANCEAKTRTRPRNAQWTSLPDSARS